MGRAPCCEKVGLKRGPWTPDEDQKLISYISDNGHGSWRALPKKAGLLRCGKSCRLRWTNYLRPDIKRGEFSLSEEQSIIQLHALLGNKWSAIATHLPKRTDNEIKNYWNTHLRKKLLKMGLDPVTHKPKLDNTLISSNTHPEANVDDDMKDNATNGGKNVAVVTQTLSAMNARGSSNGSSITSHMAQWESARLEAEARLAQESQLRSRGLWSPYSAFLGPLNAAPLSTLSPCRATKPVNNSVPRVDAYKALNAVEIIHTLQNWEKSLQGQAGMMWPEAWQLPGIHFPLCGEPPAESSSCSSPCSDANTNNHTSPSATTGSHGMDHSSPTSTLCSFDSRRTTMQQGFPSAYVAGMHSSVHMRKLSWSDALASPLTKPATPAEYCMQGMSCKVEEESSTFSSLMQDAMINADAMASAFTCPQEEVGCKSKNGLEGHGIDDDAVCEKVREVAYDEEKLALTVEKPIDDDAVCEKVREVAYDEEKLGLVVEKPTTTTCEKLASMVGDQNASEEGKEESTKDIMECGEDVMEGGGGESGTEQKPDDNLCGVVLPSAMDLEEDNMKDGIKDLKEGKNFNIQYHDVLDSSEGKTVCGGSELMSVEMFKDLPKLKSEAPMSSTHLTSFSTLLNDDMSDYWSSIMLKEPTLQQGEMTF